ncbi:glycosyltransferase family 4 protein [Mycobacterium sp. KBS0706]|uniref:glycosyltransferase family 4 protein n=1 Tax=Mycobacterium sp. KBS0706 TaxID=2578109 RepID=UPI00110FE11A|nr:glycosyltransferase family 4 protein [Mycobacterium sp. KBS0706]TSD85141.1 glycosyltransferase family 4 protein [Mycobacterium sp. KBS0706]
MKIILANRYLYPDESATSRMTSSLAFALARKGFAVHGLTSRTFHNDRDRHLPPREVTNGITIHRLATSGFGRDRLWGRALDYFTFHLSAALWVLWHAQAGDVCVVCTDPPLLSVTLALLLRLKRARMVNWLHDLFPEVALELSVVRRGRAERMALALRDWSLRRAACNVAPIAQMARFLERRRIPAERLAVVHHWSDGAAIRPIPREANPLRQDWRLGNAFIVGYSGNFGRAHEFNTILGAAAQLKHRDDIRFLFIGGGHKRAAIEAEIRARGLDNVILKPLQPRELLAESLGLADIHLVSLLPPLEPFVIPSKFYGILAAGRPTLFVGDPDGEIGGILQRHRCGHAVAIGDSETLARHILELRESPERLTELAVNARRLFETDYTERRGCCEWTKLLSRFLPSATNAVASQTTESAIPADERSRP